MKINYYIFGCLFSVAIIFESCSRPEVKNNHDQLLTDSLTRQVNLLRGNIQRTSDNKKIVADFYQALFGDKNIGVIDKYIDENYIQHNPTLPDGKEALKNAAKAWFTGAPKQKVDIQHLSADGDLVFIHTRAIMGDKTFSVIDIFRLDNGKIMEHWDVIQQVPDKSANAHPMF
jgi:predicted SnoaL-like aldol condensation-catalyzing enzyme